MLDWILDNPLLILGVLWWIFSSIKKAARVADAKRRGVAPSAPTAPATPPPLPATPLPPPISTAPPAPASAPPAPASATPAPTSALPAALRDEFSAAVLRLRAARARAQQAGLDGLIAAADLLAARCDDVTRRASDPALIASAAATSQLRRQAAALALGVDALVLAVGQRETRVLGDALPLADRVAARVARGRSRAPAVPVVSLLSPTCAVAPAVRPLLPITLLALPPDLGEHPWRWAFVAREAWHERLARDPTVASEVAALLSAVDPDLWEDGAHRISCELTGPWALELAADAATALALGSAWGHALIADALRRPPASHFALRGDAAALPLGHHVPGDLRINLVIALLARAGSALEAEEIRARWDAVIAKPATIPARTPQGLVLLPREDVLAHCELLADRIVATPLVSLRGTLAALVSEERSALLPSLEATARSVRAGLVGLAPPPDAEGATREPPDVLLAAMAGLVTTHPDPRRLRAACEMRLRRALGDDPQAQLREATRAAPRPQRRGRALRQALVLGELLTPPDARDAARMGPGRRRA